MYRTEIQNLLASTTIFINIDQLENHNISVGFFFHSKIVIVKHFNKKKVTVMLFS